MFQCKELKQRADHALQQTTCDPKQLLRIHVGAIAVLSLLLSVISYVLEEKIDATGGLSGIGTRSMLSTALSVLQLFFTIMIPLWQIGYRSVTLSIARNQAADTRTLFSGFRLFGVVLRLYLLLALLFSLLFVGSNYLSSFLYMMTPWGKSLTQELNAMMDSVSDTEALLDAFTGYAVSFWILNIVVFLAIAIPLFYRLRYSFFRVIEGQPRARMAMRESMYLTKGCWLPVLKLDLSFWWYYLAQFAIAAVGYLDILWKYLGKPSINPVILYFAPYLLYLVLQFAFQMWQKNRVDVTYALAYDALRKAKETVSPNP